MLENVGLEIEFVGHIQQEIHSYMLWHYLKQCLCPSGLLYQKTMSFIAEEGLILKEVWPAALFDYVSYRFLLKPSSYQQDYYYG